MCRKHQPVALYTRPDPATQPDLAVTYALRGHGSDIRCAACDLTGFVSAAGNVRWYTPGKVGYLSREKQLAKAAEWNQKVMAGAEAK